MLVEELPYPRRVLPKDMPLRVRLFGMSKDQATGRFGLPAIRCFIIPPRASEGP
jgi:hypothetical protein